MDDNAPDPGQLVRDLAASARMAAEELGQLQGRLQWGSRHLMAQAEQYAEEARGLLDVQNWSAAATACHRAHQCRLQAAALDTVAADVRATR
jgi:hypothetical protein